MWRWLWLIILWLGRRWSKWSRRRIGKIINWHLNIWVLCLKYLRWFPQSYSSTSHSWKSFKNRRIVFIYSIYITIAGNTLLNCVFLFILISFFIIIIYMLLLMFWRRICGRCIERMSSFNNCRRRRLSC